MLRYKALENITIGFDKEFKAGAEIPSGLLPEKESQRLIAEGVISLIGEPVQTLSVPEVGIDIAKTSTENVDETKPKEKK